MNRPTTAAHHATNIHPNYRALGLAHIRQVRMMLREGRYTDDCRDIIKAAQKDLADKRKALADKRKALAAH